MKIDPGDLLNKLLLAEQIYAEFEALKQAKVGELTTLPTIKVTLFGGHFEIPVGPAKRVG